MHQDLALVWDEVEGDDDVWAAVLAGAGHRAFSVGQDLTELADRIGQGTAGTATFGSRGKPGWPRLTERFDLAKPVVAKVRGYALGGGFELALACDIIIADEDATFALPEARLGLVAGAGGVFRLTRQLPWKVAMGHLLTGRSLSARRAYELGLVNEIVAADDLDTCVEEWVTDILRCAPLSGPGDQGGRVPVSGDVAGGGVRDPLSVGGAPDAQPGRHRGPDRVHAEA